MKIPLLNLVHNQKIKIYNFSPTQIIVLGFAIFILLGALILMLPISSRSGMATPFSTALFTATSAVCVTGLVVVDTYSYWSSFGQTVIIILIQVGGLGIMSLATFFSLLMRRKVGLKERLTIQESLNEFTLSGVVRVLKNILIGTFAIELTGAILLSTRLIPKYGLASGIAKSLFHSISAFCNAGFDIFGTSGNEFVSLVPFQNDPVIILTISFLIILGGLGFIVWRDIIVKKNLAELSLHTKVVLLVTAFLLASGTVLFLIFEYSNPATLQPLSMQSKIMNAFFQSVTPRTAGYNSLLISDLTETSKFITIILMFIGGAPGSTAGGIKVTTISVIIIAVISFIKGSEEVNILQRRVPFSIVMKSLSIIIMSFLVVIITTVILMINNEGNLMQVLFEATSAFGTVGLTTGITPNLEIISRYAVALTMFIGRVGPLSAAVAISLKHSNKKLSYKYPEGRITVG